MAKVIGIFGMSGEGKTTSTIINPDGTKTEATQEITTAPQQTIPLSPVPTVPNK